MHRLLFLFSLGCGLFTGLAARGDQWAAPTRKEVFSEGSNFVAVIEPGDKTNPPTAVLHKLSSGQRTKMWEVTLSNERSPVSAAVSPDGQHLVTFDNWHQVGYGDDVVAIYDASGQLAKYSLEEFAPLKPTPEFRPASSGYFLVISHSTSSRWWQRDSISFFHPGPTPTFFCLWLDWDSRWVAWNLQDGRLVQPTAVQTNDWNAEGRRWSLRHVSSEQEGAAARNFLGRMRVKADRPIIEKWLEDAEFFNGSSRSSSGENEMTRFVFTAYSVKREKADQILSRWDGMVSPRDNTHDHYNFLGTVRGTLRLPAAPSRSDGFLRVQLLPEDTGVTTNQQLVANLAEQSPRTLRDGRLHDLSLGTSVEFAIHGVTPGAYRVRALWDKSPPFCDSASSACESSPGDVISTNLPRVLVRKGAVALDVTVDCQVVVK